MLLRLLKKFWPQRKPAFELSPGQWVLLPLGNPGGEYALTRHNLGRLMVQRWMNGHAAAAAPTHNYRYGTVYSLDDSFLALVPSTYMNHSGAALREAMEEGLPLSWTMVIYDDKDLPLGTGRLSLDGGSGGHRGLQGIIDGTSSEGFARLRLGIGPFVRPLQDWVLGKWQNEELDIIEEMDGPFANFLSLLAKGTPLPALQSQVNAKEFWRISRG